MNSEEQKLANALVELEAGRIYTVVGYDPAAARGWGGSITASHCGEFSHVFGESEVAQFEVLFGDAWPIEYWRLALAKMSVGAA